MPLVKRAIQPVFVCRAQLDSKVKNELEGVVINSLAGVIKQLASLAKHAENLFGELYNESSNIFHRSATLNERVSNLGTRIRQLDATVKEEVRVDVIVQMNHFKSIRQEDQKVLSRHTLPTSVEDTYESCDNPPTLNKFTVYRDDEKEGLKFYTDPDYFYRLWVEDQNQQLEKRRKRERRRRRRNKENQPKKEIRVAQKKQFFGTDVEFRDSVANDSNQKAQLIRVSRTSTDEFQQQQNQGLEDTVGLTDQSSNNHIPLDNEYQALSKPSHAPPPPPPTYYDTVNQNSSKVESRGILSAPVIDPSTPPTQRRDHYMGQAVPIPVPAPPPPPNMMSNEYSYQAPPPQTSAIPPPPPPPPTNIPAPPPPPPEQILNTNVPKPQPVYDQRNDLLSAIRKGKELRQVEQQTQVDKKQQQFGTDVASILSRRIAFELSDSESGSDDSDDSDRWSD